MKKIHIQRFWRNTQKGSPTSCWPWKKSKSYGNMRIDGVLIKAHRVSWIIHNGPIPKGEGAHGMCVLHKCDIPRCVNPAHLFLGTNADNVADKMAKGRWGGGAPSGEDSVLAKLTDEMVLEMRDKNSTKTFSKKELAAIFGISPSHVYAICNRRHWKHI